MTTISTTAYLDICIGYREEYDKEEERYKKTKEVLKRKGMMYGFPEEPEQLSMEQQEILREVDVLLCPVSLDISLTGLVECRSLLTCCSLGRSHCRLDG